MTSELTEIKLEHIPQISLFIQQSYRLLEERKFTELIDWDEGGIAIVIKHPVQFSNTALPVYFKHDKLASFVRQLNMYGFRKMRTEMYEYVYYHDLFRRDSKHLLAQITKRSKKANLLNTQKIMKAPYEEVQAASKPNKFSKNEELKKLNLEAFARINALNTQIQDLAKRNQALHDNLNQHKEKEDILVLLMSQTMEKKGLTLDQLYQALEFGPRSHKSDAINDIKYDMEKQQGDTENIYGKINTTNRLNSIINLKNDLSSPIAIPSQLSTASYEAIKNNCSYEQPNVLGIRSFNAEDLELEIGKKMLKLDFTVRIHNNSTLVEVDEGGITGNEKIRNFPILEDMNTIGDNFGDFNDFTFIDYN